MSQEPRSTGHQSQNCVDWQWLERASGQGPRVLGPAKQGVKFKVMAKHLKFIARTMMVQDGNVEGAYRTLNRIFTMNGLIEDIKQQWYYEKPCRWWQRESYETCRRISNMEMTERSTSWCERIKWIRGRAAEACGQKAQDEPFMQFVPPRLTFLKPHFLLPLSTINSITHMQEGLPI